MEKTPTEWLQGEQMNDISTCEAIVEKEISRSSLNGKKKGSTHSLECCNDNSSVTIGNNSEAATSLETAPLTYSTLHTSGDLRDFSGSNPPYASDGPSNETKQSSDKSDPNLDKLEGTVNEAKQSNEAGNVEEAQQQTNAALSTQWPWIALYDEANKKPFFYNVSTQMTAWELPKEEEAKEAPERERDVALQPPIWPTPEIAPPVKKRKIKQQSQEDVPESSVAHAAKNQIKEVMRLVESDSVSAGDAYTSSANSEMRLSHTSLTPEVLVYVQHDRIPTAAQLGRPARKQCRPPDSSQTAYVQTAEDYNIWYHKHIGTDYWDRNRRDRIKATTRCNPFTDAGWTRADHDQGSEKAFICIFFAKKECHRLAGRVDLLFLQGCCYLGEDCRYYHRVPTEEDSYNLDELHDVFGRERFGQHRDDMEGVGTFNAECRTLWIGDLKVHRYHSNPEDKTRELLRQQFGIWGPLQDVNVVRNRNMAFVTYKYRAAAEFAKVAMAEQKLLLDRDDDQIAVRWAHPTRTAPNPERDARDWERASTAVESRLNVQGYTLPGWLRPKPS